MSAFGGGTAGALLLIVAGSWLLLQTLVGDLADRIVGLGPAAAQAATPQIAQTPGPNFLSGVPGTPSFNTTPPGTAPAPPPQPFLSGVPGTSTFNTKAPA